MIDADADLPSNVSDVSQLSQLPPQCLSSEAVAAIATAAALYDIEKDRSSNDNSINNGSNNGKCIQLPDRPLRHVDDSTDQEYYYSLNPMSYAVIFILLVELFERFSFYGIYYTQTLFLTGAYNDDWNAGFASVTASTFVSISTMVAYTTPFIGAYVSDRVFGDYYTLLLGLLVFYIPGIVLIVLTTIPNLFGRSTFNRSMLTTGILFLWPLGTGIVKSIVNVFGAKQFHPFLQSSLIESYYVSFYTVINVGSLAGICIIPIIAQRSILVAYLIPLSMLLIGAMCFVFGTARYNVQLPKNNTDNNNNNNNNHKDASSLFSWCYCCCSGGGGQNKKGRQQCSNPEVVIKKKATTKVTTLFEIFRISLLVVPFNIGYNQMPTTFILQGTVMSKAFGFLDVASMNCLDAISVLIFGSITANYIYPQLVQRGIKIPTTHKFAIGSVLGSLAVGWAIIVDKMIHDTYEQTGQQISVLWQAPSYILIGCGEIFAVSTAYSVAFTASPPDKKVLASATNIFCVGGLPNMICIVLYQLCRTFFTNSRGTDNIEHIEDYASANVGNYFLVLLGIMMFGAFINVVPAVKDYVVSIEERAVDLVRTPTSTRANTTPTRIVQRRRRQNNDVGDGDEEENSPLLVQTTPRTKKYRQYLKYGNGPMYNRTGSMRAWDSLTQKELSGNVGKIRYGAISKLYDKDDGDRSNAGSKASKTKTIRDSNNKIRHVVKLSNQKQIMKKAGSLGDFA